MTSARARSSLLCAPALATMPTRRHAHTPVAPRRLQGAGGGGEAAAEGGGACGGSGGGGAMGMVIPRTVISRTIIGCRHRHHCRHRRHLRHHFRRRRHRRQVVLRCRRCHHQCHQYTMHYSMWPFSRWRLLCARRSCGSCVTPSKHKVYGAILKSRSLATCLLDSNAL